MESWDSTPSLSMIMKLQGFFRDFCVVKHGSISACVAELNLMSLEVPHILSRPVVSVGTHE